MSYNGSVRLPGFGHFDPAFSSTTSALELDYKFPASSLAAAGAADESILENGLDLTSTNCEGLNLSNSSGGGGRTEHSSHIHSTVQNLNKVNESEMIGHCTHQGPHQLHQQLQQQQDLQPEMVLNLSTQIGLNLTRPGQDLDYTNMLNIDHTTSFTSSLQENDFDYYSNYYESYNPSSLCTMEEQRSSPLNLEHRSSPLNLTAVRNLSRKRKPTAQGDMIQSNQCVQDFTFSFSTALNPGNALTTVPHSLVTNQQQEVNTSNHQQQVVNTSNHQQQVVNTSNHQQQVVNTSNHQHQNIGHQPQLGSSHLSSDHQGLVQSVEQNLTLPHQNTTGSSTLQAQSAGHPLSQGAGGRSVSLPLSVTGLDQLDTMGQPLPLNMGKLTSFQIDQDFSCTNQAFDYRHPAKLSSFYNHEQQQSQQQMQQQQFQQLQLGQPGQQLNHQQQNHQMNPSQQAQQQNHHMNQQHHNQQMTQQQTQHQNQHPTQQHNQHLTHQQHQQTHPMTQHMTPQQQQAQQLTQQQQNQQQAQLQHTQQQGLHHVLQVEVKQSSSAVLKDADLGLSYGFYDTFSSSSNNGVLQYTQEQQDTVYDLGIYTKDGERARTDLYSGCNTSYILEFDQSGFTAPPTCIPLLTSSRLQADQQPSSRLQADHQPSNRLQADQQPSSRLQADQQPSSRQQADQQSSSRLQADQQQSSSRLQADQQQQPSQPEPKNVGASLPENTLCCEDCKLQFMEESQLLTHNRSYHTKPVRPKNRPAKGSSTPGRPVNLSPQKKSINIVDLAKLKEDIIKDPQPFQCVNCGQKFSSRPGLLAHLDLHNQNKPYKCSVCNLGFTFQSARKRHELAHSNIKPYSCNKCSKVFSRKTDLHNHLNTHNKSSQISCQNCAQMFTNEKEATRHSCSAREPRGIPCPVCGAALATKVEWGAHMWKHSKDAKYIVLSEEEELPLYTPSSNQSAQKQTFIVSKNKSK